MSGAEGGARGEGTAGRGAGADGAAGRGAGAGTDGGADADKGLVSTTSGSGAAREATSASPGWTGAVGEPTRLLLLRHGQTPMSVDRRYSGSTSNPSLTDFGRRQARAAAERMALGDWDISWIIASPLARALETAEYASAELGLDIHVDDDLRETDFGTWEGLKIGRASCRERV